MDISGKYLMGKHELISGNMWEICEDMWNLCEKYAEIRGNMLKIVSRPTYRGRARNFSKSHNRYIGELGIFPSPNTCKICGDI